MPVEDFNLKVRQAAAEGNLAFLTDLFGRDGQKQTNVDINAAGASSGKTALHQAVIFGKTEVVEFLVKVKGIKLTRDHAGRTAFNYAAALHDDWLLEVLINKFDHQGGSLSLDVVPADDLVFTFGADRYLELVNNLKNLSLAEIMKIARDEIPPGKRYMGFSFLYYVVAYSRNVEAIKAVARLGEDHNLKTAAFQLFNWENTPLHYLLSNENIDAAINFAHFLLHEAGKQIDFSIRDSKGRTTLFLAASVRSPEALCALINFGAQDALAICDHNGRNVLHVAALLGSARMFEILSGAPQFGELMNQADYQGKKPLDMLDCSRQETRRFIITRHIDPDRNFLTHYNRHQNSTTIPDGKSFLDLCMEEREVIRRMDLPTHSRTPRREF